KLNFYWFSRLDRRHSKEIAKNPKISIYILVHEDKPTEKYVIGISTEGTAQLVDTNDEIDNIKAYVAKFSISKSFLDDVISGKEPHKFYKFTPSNFVLFDNKNFPEQSRQEWTVET
ncbi:MAG TPA: pyridoxamine 5'-phosphate oxidase family protein, partial [Candidatus Saccharimonadales bacterium]|nr:pyridoxamine 5'-phosphate oxidase family protein [Candidatus Saccharimonadales bacterium]